MRALTLMLTLLLAPQIMATNQSAGEINKIDLAKKMIIISIECDCGSGRMSDTNFYLKDETKVLVNGKASTLADLKTGDQVDIDYESTDNVQKISAIREQ